MADLSLTTHVLDQSCGQPGRGISLSLYCLESQGRLEVCSTITNDDGRTDQPLIASGQGAPGVYELVFQASAYFQQQGIVLSEPPFLDQVVLRFGMTDGGGHYHVPLLLSPYGYSTYRGS